MHLNSRTLEHNLTSEKILRIETFYLRWWKACGR